MESLEQTLDSREVAGMVEKEHRFLMRDIRRYINQIIEGNEKYFTECKIAPSDFFKESEYKDSTGRTLPCYRITKKGCEFIAHKLTGTKGTIFTARYINRFHEMEDEIQKKAESAIQTSELSNLASVVESVMVRQNCGPCEIAKVINQLFKQFGVKLPKEFINTKAVLTLECTGMGRKKKITDILENINDERFLNQIRTLLKLHIEKKGGAA